MPSLHSSYTSGQSSSNKDARHSSYDDGKESPWEEKSDFSERLSSCFSPVSSSGSGSFCVPPPPPPPSDDSSSYSDQTVSDCRIAYDECSRSSSERSKIKASQRYNASIQRNNNNDDEESSSLSSDESSCLGNPQNSLSSNEYDEDERSKCSSNPVKRRYNSDCCDFTSLEEGKSDTSRSDVILETSHSSGETNLGDLRFDYSDISSTRNTSEVGNKSSPNNASTANSTFNTTLDPPPGGNPGLETTPNKARHSKSCEDEGNVELGSLRFDYSDISLTSNKSVRQLDQSNIISANSSFGAIQSELASMKLDPPARDSHGPLKSAGPAKLQACFQILETFAIRAAFDHWRRGVKCEEYSFGSFGSPLSSVLTYDNTSIHSSEHSLSPSGSVSTHDVLTRNFINTFESLATKSVKRSAFSLLKTNVHAEKRIEAIHIMHQVLRQAKMRCALIRWSNATKRITWLNAVVEEIALAARHSLVQKVLISWRKMAINAVEMRQRYFLMVIMNRWRLYTEECIELRQKKYAALLHWANTKSKKAFDALRLHAKQSKEEKRLSSTSFLQTYNSKPRQGSMIKSSCSFGDRRSFHSNGTQQHALSRFVTPSSHGSKSTYTNHTNSDTPFSISYRSPDASMIWNRGSTPDEFNRLGHTYSNGAQQQNRIGTGSRSSSSDRTRGVQFQAQPNQPSNLRSPFLPPRASSRVSNQSPPVQSYAGASGGGRTEYNSQIIPKPSAHGGTGYLSNAGGGSPAYLTSDSGQQHQSSAFMGTLGCRTSLEVEQNRGPSLYQYQPGSVGLAQLQVGGISQSSVRSIRDYYQDKLVIANVLDEMVSRVEERQTRLLHSTPFFGYSSNRYLPGYPPYQSNRY